MADTFGACPRRKSVVAIMKHLSNRTACDTADDMPHSINKPRRSTWSLRDCRDVRQQSQTLSGRSFSVANLSAESSRWTYSQLVSNADKHLSNAEIILYRPCDFESRVLMVPEWLRQQDQNCTVSKVPRRAQTSHVGASLETSQDMSSAKRTLARPSALRSDGRMYVRARMPRKARSVDGRAQAAAAAVSSHDKKQRRHTDCVSSAPRIGCDTFYFGERKRAKSKRAELSATVCPRKSCDHDDLHTRGRVLGESDFTCLSHDRYAQDASSVTDNQTHDLAPAASSDAGVNSMLSNSRPSRPIDDYAAGSATRPNRKSSSPYINPNTISVITAGTHSLSSSRSNTGSTERRLEKCRSLPVLKIATSSASWQRNTNMPSNVDVRPMASTIASPLSPNTANSDVKRVRSTSGRRRTVRRRVPPKRKVSNRGKQNAVPAFLPAIKEWSPTNATSKRRIQSTKTRPPSMPLPPLPLFHSSPAATPTATTTIMTIPQPNRWRPTIYIPGPICIQKRMTGIEGLPPTALSGEKTRSITLDIEAQAVNDEICEYFDDFGFEPVSYLPDSFDLANPRPVKRCKLPVVPGLSIQKIKGTAEVAADIIDVSLFSKSPFKTGPPPRRAAEVTTKKSPVTSPTNAVSPLKRTQTQRSELKRPRQQSSPTSEPMVRVDSGLADTAEQAKGYRRPKTPHSLSISPPRANHLRQRSRGPATPPLPVPKASVASLRSSSAPTGSQPPLPDVSGFSGLSKLTAQVLISKENQELPLPPLQSAPPPPSATLSTFSQAENCIYDQISTLNASAPLRSNTDPERPTTQAQSTRPPVPAFHFPLRPNAPTTTSPQSTLAPKSPPEHLRSRSADHPVRHATTRTVGNASVDFDWWGSETTLSTKGSRPTWRSPAPVLPPPPPIEVQIQMQIQAQTQANTMKGHRRQGSAMGGRIRRLVAMA